MIPVEMLDISRELDVTSTLPGTLQDWKGCSKRYEEISQRADLPQEELYHREQYISNDLLPATLLLSLREAGPVGGKSLPTARYLLSPLGQSLTDRLDTPARDAKNDG